MDSFESRRDAGNGREQHGVDGGRRVVQKLTGNADRGTARVNIAVD